jgi:hypothetical protein
MDTEGLLTNVLQEAWQNRIVEITEYAERNGNDPNQSIEMRKARMHFDLDYCARSSALFGWIAELCFSRRAVNSLRGQEKTIREYVLNRANLDTVKGICLMALSGDGATA